MLQKIIPKYILKEIVPNYLIGLGFLSVILFVVQIFQMIRLVVEKNIPANKVVTLLILYLPLIFQFTLPIAVIVGTLLAVGRLSDDSEIIAMRACGISLFKVFLPTVVFGIVMTLFTLFFYEYILPIAAKQYAKAKVELYQINPTAELSKSLSFNTIDGVKITVDSVDTSTNELVNVRINYRNENKLIFARRALLLGKDYEKNVFPLILFNATTQPANLKQPNISYRFDEEYNVRQTIYIPDRPVNATIPLGNQLIGMFEFYNKIKNKDYELALSNYRDYNRLNNYEIRYKEKIKAFKKYIKETKVPSDPKKLAIYKDQIVDKKIEIKKLEILTRQLKDIIERRQSSEGRSSIRNDQYLFHRKIAFSFSALAFALLGAPLGIFSKRAGKSMGLGLSIILIIVFFVMIVLGNYLMKRDLITPLVASWYPNWILFIAGVLFIIQRLSGKESWSIMVSDMFYGVRKNIFGKLFNKKIKI